MYNLPAVEAAKYGAKAASQVMRVKVLTGMAFTSPADDSLKIPPLVKSVPQHLRSEETTCKQLRTICVHL